jgi:hypothetical protein
MVQNVQGLTLQQGRVENNETGKNLSKSFAEVILLLDTVVELDLDVNLMNLTIASTHGGGKRTTNICNTCSTEQ